jgi:hypothetical protein
MTALSKSNTPAKIVDLLLQGHSIPQIIEYGRESGMDAEGALPDVITYLEAVASQPRKQVIGFCMESLRDIYRQALTVGDFSLARSCIMDLAKLAAADSVKPARATRKSACR